MLLLRNCWELVASPRSPCPRGLLAPSLGLLLASPRWGQSLVLLPRGLSMEPGATEGG